MVGSAVALVIAFLFILLLDHFLSFASAKQIEIICHAVIRLVLQKSNQQKSINRKSLSKYAYCKLVSNQRAKAICFVKFSQYILGSTNSMCDALFDVDYIFYAQRVDEVLCMYSRGCHTSATKIY